MTEKIKEEDIEFMSKDLAPIDRVNYMKDRIEEALADKDKYIKELAGLSSELRKDVLELRSKIKELKKELKQCEECELNFNTQAISDTKKQKDLEWRKKIEEIKDEIGKIYYACNDERVFEIQKRLGELGTLLEKELLDGSSKSKEVGNRESHSPSTVKEDHLSSDDVKPLGKYSKQILYFGEKVIVSCDGKCELSKGDKDTWEGGHGYNPKAYENFPSKWCVRQCDRCNETSISKKSGEGKNAGRKN